MKIIWCMVPEILAWRTDFFFILDHFLPIYPPKNPKNQNFEKKKKTPGDITILHMCPINDNHTMYGSWDMECDRIFCHFGPFFALLPPWNPKKIKILKKLKKTLEILSFYTSVPKMMVICYTVPEIWHVTCNYFSFWAIFCPFPT